MQNSESYRHKEKRKDNLSALVILLVVVAVALGVRWYSDTHQPPVHPLKVTIAERDIPQNPLYSISDNYFPSGELFVRDNMKELAAGREIETREGQWELVDVQQRASSNTKWAPPQFPDGAKPPPLPVNLRMNSDKLPYSMINGFASHAGEWKITIRASRSYYDPNSKEEWVGSGEYVLTRTLREDIKGAQRAKEIAARRERGLPDPTQTPPPGVHPLDPRKDYVAGIQWSDDNGKTWLDIPQKGQKGFPLMLAADIVTGFRAVKKNPRDPWPDWSGQFFSGVDEILVWGGQVHPGTLTGEAVWIQPSESQNISQSANDLKTIKVSCGNTVTRQICVLPPVEIELDAATIEAIPGQSKYRRVPLTAKAEWSGAWHPATKFRFAVEKAKYKTLPPKKGQRFGDTIRTATPIGQINKPGASDDVVVAAADDSAKATLTVPVGAGKIEVRAILLAPNGSKIWQEIQRIDVPTS